MVHANNRIDICIMRLSLDSCMSHFHCKRIVTCRLFDIRSEKGYEQMKVEFEEVIGRHYLKAVHLNDSKGE